MNIYQDALGGWVVFDGTMKQHVADFVSANQIYRRLKIMSAIKEFQATMDGIGNQVEVILPLVDMANDLFIVNQLESLLNATPAGGLVGDSALTKESLGVCVELLATFITFANTPLAGVGLTPKQIVRLRG